MLFDTMAYTGTPPWAGLGVHVKNADDLEAILKDSGADFEVGKIDNFINFNKRPIRTGAQTLVRLDNGKIFSTVPKKWNPLQNRTAFEFFQKFIKEGHMEFDTAGTLDGGKTVWILAKVKKTFRVGRSRKHEDIIESYLLFTIWHQYGKSTTVCATPIRVSCKNSLLLALNGHKDMIIRVTHRKAFDPEEVQKALYLNDKQLKMYEEKANFLATKRASKEDMAEFFKVIFPFAKDTGDNDNIEEDNIVGLFDDISSNDRMTPSATKMMELVDEQPGSELNAGTWWSAFNTITYATDHILGRDPNTRLKMAFYGRGKDRKRKALETALDFAKVA